MFSKVKLHRGCIIVFAIALMFFLVWFIEKKAVVMTYTTYDNQIITYSLTQQESEMFIQYYNDVQKQYFDEDTNDIFAKGRNERGTYSFTIKDGFRIERIGGLLVDKIFWTADKFWYPSFFDNFVLYTLNLEEKYFGYVKQSFNSLSSNGTPLIWGVEELVSENTSLKEVVGRINAEYYHRLKKDKPINIDEIGEVTVGEFAEKMMINENIGAEGNYHSIRIKYIHHFKDKWYAVGVAYE